jgi:hypothetical protein
MRGDRLVSATIFTLAIIALSAFIGYERRIRQTHITVLSSQGSADAEVLSSSMRREPSSPRGSRSADFAGLDSKPGEARTWIAWRRAERNVTRAWNE